MDEDSTNDQDNSASGGGLDRSNLLLSGAVLLALLGSPFAGANPALAEPAQAGGKPNIIVIMGDDIGWFNIGAYHRGMMAGKTPNLDKLAAKACSSTPITPRRAAPPAAPISSPASCPSAPG